MKKGGLLLVILFVSGYNTGILAQQTDSSHPQQPVFVDSINRKAANTYDSLTSIPGINKFSVKTYTYLLADNYKKQLLFPAYLNKKGWIKFSGYIATSGMVALVNKPVKDFAVRLHNESKVVDVTSRYITRFGGPYLNYSMPAILAIGLVSKDRRLQNTVLLASQAYIISNVLGGTLKVLTSVQGPFYTDPLTNKTGPIFHGPFYTLKKDPNGNKLRSTNYVSMPSGHTYSAFSVATVFAMEYKDKPLIPVVCYGLATLVGLSRLTENRHWAMDILPGALLGYYSGKQVINNYRRQNLPALQQKKVKHLFFDLLYQYPQITPSLSYKF